MVFYDSPSLCIKFAKVLSTKSILLSLGKGHLKLHNHKRSLHRVTQYTTQSTSNLLTNRYSQRHLICILRFYLILYEDLLERLNTATQQYTTQHNTQSIPMEIQCKEYSAHLPLESKHLS